MTADELISLPHDKMVAHILRWTTPAALKSTEWEFWRRDDQIPPSNDWRVWLVMAGRGYGKTRMGAEWVNRGQLYTKRTGLIRGLPSGPVPAFPIDSFSGSG
jgi:phage terminase large subunit-like protein